MSFFFCFFLHCWFMLEKWISNFKMSKMKSIDISKINKFKFITKSCVQNIKWKIIFWYNSRWILIVTVYDFLYFEFMHKKINANHWYMSSEYWMYQRIQTLKVKHSKWIKIRNLKIYFLNEKKKANINFKWVAWE